jgi:hypothetical protein
MPQDHVAPTGRYVVQPHRHMRRFRQNRDHIGFRTREQRMFFPHDAAAGNAPLGLSRGGLPATPPADAGGYRNRVPSGRLQCALTLRLDGFPPLLITPPALSGAIDSGGKSVRASPGSSLTARTTLVIARAVGPWLFQWARKRPCGRIGLPRRYAPRNDEVEGKRMGFSSAFDYTRRAQLLAFLPRGCGNLLPSFQPPACFSISLS